ncbi:hypothetical protein [Caballeronia sp. BR00000012568055]|uniref:hypothetical protein n=1 Tax=Caballeronia sp. BR00000012568055 TaxID=2918761 RepID=UPI0023F8D111|nr:hypothetical protein [Caballeronia sp. BR00000012568055]
MRFAVRQMLDAFSPGVNVAVTPGKVVWHNSLCELDAIHARYVSCGARARLDHADIDHHENGFAGCTRRGAIKIGV